MNTQKVPLNILDLIPWRPPPPHQDAFHLYPHIWSHLPEDLLHSVLQLLPFQSVLRFRCVSKQWKALFASPEFHHFASHRARVPPLIFFFGDTIDNSDGGYEDDVPDGNLSDESMSDDMDEDSNDVKGYEFEDHDNGGCHFYDFLMGGDEQGGSHDVMSCYDHGNIERGGIHNVMPDVMRYCNQDLHDHGDMYDVIRYDDLRDMHDGDHLAICDVNHIDDDFSKCRMNDKEVPEVCELLLIFDCETESWRSPLALPPGFRRSRFLSMDVCTFEEQLLFSALCGSVHFLFNPASPPFKELPPCIAILNLEASGFVEERATLPGDIASSNLSHLSKEKERSYAQDTTAKILKIVAVGDTVNDTNIVEMFDSVSGSWHVIGRLPQSDDFIFAQSRLMYCKGCFYGLLPNGIIIMSNVLKGQTLEWKTRDYPQEIPYRHGDLSGRYPELAEQHLVATKESVFMVGVTFTCFDSYANEDLDILIWQFHPDAVGDACWELLANIPSRTQKNLNAGIGDLDCLANGDLIFLSCRNRQRFLVYDVPRKLWRFSPKCKFFIGSMAFVWEPFLRS